MSKSIKYIAASCGLIIILLLLIPYLISLESYKEAIISKVREQTGRELTIGGKMSFAIFPAPKIELTKLKLSSLPHAKAANLIEVGTIQAKLAILPLLTGNIALSNLVLDKPVINLEKLQNGKNTWELQTHSVAGQRDSTASPTTTSSKDKNFLRSLPFIIHNIRIKHGSLNYIDGGNASEIWVEDLGVNIASVDGPIDFSLDLKSLGRDLVLKGQIKEIAAKMPFSLSMTVFDDKINLDGVLDTDSNIFNGIIKAEGGLKHLGDLIPEGLRDQHFLAAVISADKEKVLIKDIILDMGAISGAGEMTHNLSTEASNLELVLNPGNIRLHLASGAQSHEQLGGQVKLTAGNLDAFVAALKVDSSKLPFALNSELSLSADLFFGDQSFLLQNTTFTLGKIQIKGEIGAKNWLDKLSIPYDLNIAGVDSLLKLLGQKLPVHLEEVRIKGETVFDQESIVTNTQITTAKSTITSKGKINTNQGAKSSILVSATGSSLSQTLRELLPDSSNVNLGAFNIEAQIEGDLTAGNSVNLVIGKNGKSTIVICGETTHINSNLSLTSGSGKPHFDLDMTLSALNLGKLSAAQTKGARSSSVSSAQRSGGHWSHEKIDLAGIDSVNGNVHLKIQKLIKDSLVFNNVIVKSELSDGVLKISSLTGGLYGGKLEGSGSLSSKGSRTVIFKASLKDALLRNILPEGQKIKITDGTVDFSCDLQSQGATEFEYVSNLQGGIHLDGKEGMISGMDLHKITQFLKKPKDLSSLGQGLQSSVGKGETDFSKLGSDISVAKGIMNITRCEMTSHELSASATGQINLPQFSLDAIATVDAKIKNMPPIKVHFYGSLDNPHHKLDTQAIMQYMVDHVLTGAIEGLKHGKINPKDIVNEIFNGGGGEGAEPQAQEEKGDSPPADAAKKLIKNGLDSLFK